MSAYSFQITDHARALAAKMNFRALLDQACCPRINADPDHMYGAVFLGGHRDTRAKDIQHMRDLCLATGNIPPFVTGDLECGAGVMARDLTHFQSQMAIGAADDEWMAFEIGRISGLEGRATGYDWSFSPCVDIAADVDNPITSVRTSGTSPGSIIPAARGYLQGMQEAGMLATLKHFPGEGHTPYDQHLTTIHNPLSMEDWRNGPGLIYRELIEAGAATVMPGHISLPAFDKKGYKCKSPMPCTISAGLKNDLLRGELGFKGLIVSDAMNMGGIANYGNYYEMCALFWETGGDLLLFPMVGERFYKEMDRLRTEGILKEETLRDRVERLLSVKDKEGLLDGRKMPGLDLEPGKKLARELAAKSATLIRDRAGVLPLEADRIKKVLHLVLDCQDSDLYDTSIAARQFQSALEGAYEKVDLLNEDIHGSQIHEMLYDGKYDAVITSIFTGPSYGNSTIRLRSFKARAMMHGWMTLGTPVVFVMHRHPFTYTEFEEGMDCVIATYGSMQDSMNVVVDGILGRRNFTGRLP